MFIDEREREGERERRERETSVASHMHGNATWVGALTGNQTCTFLVCGMTIQPTEPPGQGDIGCLMLGNLPMSYLIRNISFFLLTSPGSFLYS